MGEVEELEIIVYCLVIGGLGFWGYMKDYEESRGKRKGFFGKNFYGNVDFRIFGMWEIIVKRKWGRGVYGYDCVDY